MTIVETTTVPIVSDHDIVRARAAGRDRARTLGFGAADQTRLATAISELARNVLRYAGTGVCVIVDKSDLDRMRIHVTVEDHGPGIPDLELAMTDGFTTTKNSLGFGLPGARRLVQAFDVESEPGHTVITMVLCRRRKRAASDVRGRGKPR